MLSRRGRCLIFAWGPPWVWVPRLHRSRFGMGWSLIWLWFGVYLFPFSYGEMVARFWTQRTAEGIGDLDGILEPLTEADRRKLRRLCRALGGLRCKRGMNCVRCGLPFDDHGVA